MDYLGIVLEGYFNENNREFLEKYFLREYKKYEKEQFFEADEFFNGCLKVIESWEKHLQDKVFEQKRELYLMLNIAKNDTFTYAELEGKTIEHERQEIIEYCTQELKDVRPDGIGSLSFTAHLHSLTNRRIAYNMTYGEIFNIKQSILKAFQKSQSNIEPLPPQQSEKSKKTKPKALEFKAFFNDKVSEIIIDNIQNEFTDYRGKKMAILIYLLQSEYKIINLINNSKNQSRKHFIKALTKVENIKVQSIDKVFQSGTNNIKHNNTDADYINIKNQVNKLIK